MNRESPFHAGERMLQDRAGVRNRIERIGQRAIHDFVPEAHRQFLATLRVILIATADRDGRPWASLMTGAPGFVSAPDLRHIEIAGAIVAGDPLAENLATGGDTAVLAIDLETRRRVRIGGKVVAAGADRFRIAVEQSFANCPQHIHARRLLEVPEREAERIVNRRCWHLESLDSRSQRLIETADSFYIATRYIPTSAACVHGADISHKGGRPGFVRCIDERRLVFPDFAGNNYFNTLGNLVVNPRAGLLIPDFDDGAVLMLTGSARIVTDESRVSQFDGARSIVEFEMERGLIIEGALPLPWELLSRSPDVEDTGVWRMPTRTTHPTAAASRNVASQRRI